MQDHVSDAFAFLVVLCLPLVVWVVSRPPIWLRIRPRLEPVAVAAWRQLVVPYEPDEADLRRWATLRFEQLRGHLERVRLLIMDDEHMTAVRQVGNRMAYERLVRDAQEAEDALLTFGPVEPEAVFAAPTPLSASRLAFSAPVTRPVVEMIEFGPTGRWL